MSYKRAWLLLDSMHQAFTERLSRARLAEQAAARH
jgi:molybdenum-dependent DNA-binding transcriptional regulator ModE